jgi:hypothetical protein
MKMRLLRVADHSIMKWTILNPDSNALAGHIPFTQSNESRDSRAKYLTARNSKAAGGSIWNAAEWRGKQEIDATAADKPREKSLAPLNESKAQTA